MKQETNILAQTEAEITKPASPDALAKVADAVRQDAAKDAQQYLDDSNVPEGGE